ncbi:MAG TPA: AbrB family transcriptional regulator, partial [Firmicutes bacterium]|nr:AbrB family transcriptional regulator [Bacillota bacterium]
MLKSTGIVRKIDELGRFVLPMEMRKMMGIEIKDPMEVYFDSETQSIILKQYKPGCVFCGSVDGTKLFKGHYVCKECVKGAKENI